MFGINYLTKETNMSRNLVTIIKPAYINEDVKELTTPTPSSYGLAPKIVDYRLLDKTVRFKDAISKFKVSCTKGFEQVMLIEWFTKWA